MATSLTKVIIIMLAINTVLLLGGVRVIGDAGDDFLGKFIDGDAYATNGTITVNTDSGGIGNAVSDDLAKSGTELLSFVDALAAVKAAVTFLINLVFAPIGLFTATGMPASVTLMLGVPLMTIAVMGVIYFIRSGN